MYRIRHSILTKHPFSWSTQAIQKQQQPKRLPSGQTQQTRKSWSKKDSELESDHLNAPSSLGRQDDGLARYPHLYSPGGVLRGLDYAGTITFALTGSVTAAQSGLDVFGCCMVGMVTGVGGGTIRDAVFLAKRPFWTFETEYIWMTVAMAFLTFYAWPSVLEYKEARRDKTKVPLPLKGEEIPNNEYDAIDATLDTLDSIGLAAFAIIGAQNGVRAGTSMVVSAICGMTTSTFGGLTVRKIKIAPLMVHLIIYSTHTALAFLLQFKRDILCGRPVRIVHSNAEVYAEPALAGATVYLLARKKLKASPAISIFSAMVTCMGSRYIAIRKDVKLHTWDSQNDGLGISVRE